MGELIKYLITQGRSGTLAKLVLGFQVRGMIRALGIPSSSMVPTLLHAAALIRGELVDFDAIYADPVDALMMRERAEGLVEVLAPAFSYYGFASLSAADVAPLVDAIADRLEAFPQGEG